MPLLRLEVFEAGPAQDRTTLVTDLDAVEESRLASYEQGYSAGWEDCVTAQTDEKKQLAADLSHNLQCLNFTYHEARVHILRAIEPLIIDLVGQVLPTVAKSALAPIVSQALTPLAEIAAESPIKILFNPASRPVLEPLLQKANGPPLLLVEEVSLGEGQVYLQLGENEVRVDMGSAIAQIKAAVDDYFNLLTKESPNG